MGTHIPPRTVRNGEQIAMTSTVAASMLGISRSHFYKLRASDSLPAPIRLGRCTRWRADELRDWVEAGCPPRNRWEQIREEVRHDR